MKMEQAVSWNVNSEAGELPRKKHKHSEHSESLKSRRLLEWLCIHLASYLMCYKEVKGERASRRLLSMKRITNTGPVYHYYSVHDTPSFKPNSW